MTEEHATAGPPPVGGRPDNAFLALVRIPVFRRLWAAIAVSSLGDWLGLLATTAMAQQLTREESLAVQGAAISGVILTRLLPDLVLGPLAGALADRLDRRTTVVVGELLALMLYLSIAVTYELTWLYVAQFLVEAVGLFTNPAKQAMWVSIVPRERLAVANQVSLFSVYGAVPVAALLFALLSTVSRLIDEGDGNEAQTAIVVALVVNAGSFGLSAATVLFSRRLIPGTPVDRDIGGTGTRDDSGRPPGQGHSLYSGGFGSTIRPKVDALTPARHAYQATAAVTRPRYPPSVVRPSLCATSPAPSTKNVAASRVKSRASTAVVRREATHMMTVKMPQPMRYQPTTVARTSASGMSAA